MQNLVEDIKKTEEKAAEIIKQAEIESVKKLENFHVTLDQKKEQELENINKKIEEFEKQSNIEIEKELKTLKGTNQEKIAAFKKINTKEVSQKILSNLLG